MIVATRLSAVWQVAGVAGAALCCYLVSQSVASERGALDKVDRQIAQAHDDITKLQTEIGVRARQGQLEAWNRDVLALQAPRPSQFVSSGIQLASLYGHRGQPALQLDPAIAAQQGAPTNVSYQPGSQQTPPAAPAPQTAEASAPVPQPVLRTATYVRPVPSRLGSPSVDAAPTLQKASFEVIKTPAPAPHVELADAKPARTEQKPAAKSADKTDRRASTAKAKPVETAEKAATPGKSKAEKSKGAEPVKLASRDPLPKSLLPADIGALAARETHGAKAAR